MKRSLFFVTVFTLIFCMLAACGPEESPDTPSGTSSHSNPFAEGAAAGTTINAFYSFGVDGYDNREARIEYTGSPIKLDFFIDNLASPCEVGILIFLNGQLQPYSIEGQADLENMHRFQLKEQEKKTFSILFDPVTGKRGEEVVVHFVGMLNPSFTPKAASVVFGNNHNILQTSPYKLVMHKAANAKPADFSGEVTSTDFTHDFTQRYTMRNADGSVRNLLEKQTFFQISDQNGDPLQTVSLKNDPLSLNIQLFGGQEATYLISLYCNHQQLACFNGKPYIALTNKKGCVNTVTASLDANHLELSEYNHLYAIAVPIDKVFSATAESILKTGSAVLTRSSQG